MAGSENAPAWMNNAGRVNGWPAAAAGALEPAEAAGWRPPDWARLPGRRGGRWPAGRHRCPVGRLRAGRRRRGGGCHDEGCHQRRHCGRSGRPGGCRDNGREGGRVDAANLDHGRAIAQHVELCSGRVREVDDSIADEGTAIVDPHHDAAAVLQIRDPYVGGQRQSLMSGGHGVHIVGLAGRGPQLVEAGSIP